MWTHFNEWVSLYHFTINAHCCSDKTIFVTCHTVFIHNLTTNNRNQQNMAHVYYANHCWLWCISKILQYSLSSVRKFENSSEVTFDSVITSFQHRLTDNFNSVARRKEVQKILRRTVGTRVTCKRCLEKFQTHCRYIDGDMCKVSNWCFCEKWVTCRNGASQNWQKTEIVHYFYREVGAHICPKSISNNAWGKFLNCFSEKFTFCRSDISHHFTFTGANI